MKRGFDKYDVLHLVSWYPNEDSPMNGDFIERQVEAISHYSSAALLFVQFIPKLKRTRSSIHKVNQHLTVFKIEYNNLIIESRGLSFLKYMYYNIRFLLHLFRSKNRPNLLHVHVSYRSGILALMCNYVYRIPYVISEHWTLFTNERSSEYLSKNFIFRKLTRLIFKNSTYVLPVSTDLENRLKVYFPYINSTVVPNVVDPELFYFNFNKCYDKFKFIHVSSGNPIKNFDKIINTFLELKKKFSDISLTIVGPEVEDLKVFDLVLLENMDVKLCGKIGHKAVAEQMRMMNSFILFSDYETQSCVSIEALCCGLPVISSKLPCIEEFIDDSNGILVPPGDEDALYNAMETMILNYSRYDRKKISEDAQAKYNPDVVGRQIVDVYEKALSKK